MIRPFVAWRFRRGFSAGLLWMPGRGHRAHSHVPGQDSLGLPGGAVTVPPFPRGRFLLQSAEPARHRHFLP